MKAAPARAESRLHAAVVYAAAGMQGAATKELSEAVRLDPKLEESDEVKALRAKLKLGAEYHGAVEHSNVRPDEY